MDKNELTLFWDDNQKTVMERVALALGEIGIRTRLVQMHDDFSIYEFSRAEKLDNGDSSPQKQ